VPGFRLLVLAAAALAALAGCVNPRAGVDLGEGFASTSTYSRTYAVLDAQACEAARRSLLSQGYVISVASAEQVRGHKSFQPSADTHVEVEFNVVCVKDGFAGRRSIAFVNAVQDSYALKKGSTSASLGLPALGAVSLPFMGSDEAMVKVASVTIASTRFYDGFFELLEHYLEGDRGQLIAPMAGTTLDPPAARPAPVSAPASAALPGASLPAPSAASGTSP
jgi:hypothetical protein